jgi:hypothetical protein
MMRQIILAATAAMALAACNQQGGSGPPLPRPQAGVQTPSVPVQPAQPPQQANITDDVRRQLIDNIGQQLNQIAANFAAGKSAPTGSADEIAPMQPGTDHRWRFNLSAGVEYTVIGACDGDCHNVDIELIDSRGGVVASDMLPDDYPVVNFTPQADGVYYARLLMQNCSVAPCYGGMRLLSAASAAAGK